MEADVMMRRSQLGLFGAALLVITVPAGAVPISGGVLKDVAAADRQIDAVHYRDWRHCHWRRGYRYCHGGDDYDYGYDDYYGYPSYSVFRFGHRHHRHHGHHGHHRHHGHHGGHRGGHGGRR